jgi:hypothetical protein
LLRFVHGNDLGDFLSAIRDGALTPPLSFTKEITQPSFRLTHTEFSCSPHDYNFTLSAPSGQFCTALATTITVTRGVIVPTLALGDGEPLLAAGVLERFVALGRARIIDCVNRRRYR